MTEPALAVSSRSFHLLAAAWGGLAGAIGLMIGLALEPTERHVVVGLAFLFGGYIAAARAPSLRLVHSLLAAAIGYAIFVVFILLANLISQAGGPDAPAFAASDSRTAALTVVWAVAGCLLGGLLATWLAYRSGRRSLARRG